MDLRSAWAQSLQLCNFSNIKLFTFVTLKAVYDVVKVLMSLWFIIPLSIFFTSVLFLSSAYSEYAITIFLILWVFRLLLKVVFVFAARPSISIKDFSYFKTMFIRATPFITVGLVFWIIYAFECMTVMQFAYTPPPLFYTILAVPIALINMLIVALSYLAMLFYLDRTEGIFIAFKRALKMYIYNFPAFALYNMTARFAVGLLRLTPSFVGLLPLRSSFLGIVINATIDVIAVLLVICITTNLYIKLVHDQYEFYFPEDKHSG